MQWKHDCCEYKIVMKARQLKLKYNKDMPAIKIKMQWKHDSSKNIKMFQLMLSKHGKQ